MWCCGEPVDTICIKSKPSLPKLAYFKFSLFVI
uniref:Uncharacterized protein n=1 Tax=Anguilla anguilla TaxID=7936 RepID=A0A0E9U7M9_ANGAN